MLSKAAVPSPTRPSRAVSVLFLGTALVLGGVATAGAASAATSGRAVSVTAAAADPGESAQPVNPWQAVMDAAAGQPSRATLAPSQRLLPTAVSGPQATLPMTPDRLANATTIVRQAMDKRMGLRSAVIAVATAMQESTLQNLQYGTYDSLGLFQQRPSAGWGTPAQITDPVYASDAFLNALRQYQASNPGWATQPLWQAAQGVQNSGFPYAYAKWEVQAAQVVAGVASHIVLITRSHRAPSRVPRPRTIRAGQTGPTARQAMTGQVRSPRAPRPARTRRSPCCRRSGSRWR